MRELEDENNQWRTKTAEMYNQIKKEEVLREKKVLEKKLEAKRMRKLIEE